MRDSWCQIETPAAQYAADGRRGLILIVVRQNFQHKLMIMKVLIKASLSQIIEAYA